MNEHLISNFATAIGASVAEEARAAIASLGTRRQQLLDSLATVDVKDDEDLRRAIDKIVLAKACREAADALLEPIGTPYREATHAVATVALGFVDDLKAAERRAQASIDAFRGRQREAAANAANEQSSREAELRRAAGIEAGQAPTIKPADVRLGNVRSDYRGQVFDRRVLKATITDPRALPDTVLNAPGVIAAMETAVRRLALLTTDIPGATVEYDQKSTVKA